MTKVLCADKMKKVVAKPQITSRAKKVICVTSKLQVRPAVRRSFQRSMIENAATWIRLANH